MSWSFWKGGIRSRPTQARSPPVRARSYICLKAKWSPSARTRRARWQPMSPIRTGGRRSRKPTLQQYRRAEQLQGVCAPCGLRAGRSGGTASLARSRWRVAASSIAATSTGWAGSQLSVPLVGRTFHTPPPVIGDNVAERRAIGGKWRATFDEDALCVRRRYEESLGGDALIGHVLLACRDKPFRSAGPCGYQAIEQSIGGRCSRGMTCPRAARTRPGGLSR